MTVDTLVPEPSKLSSLRMTLIACDPVVLARELVSTKEVHLRRVGVPGTLCMAIFARRTLRSPVLVDMTA